MYKNEENAKKVEIYRRKTMDKYKKKLTLFEEIVKICVKMQDIKMRLFKMCRLILCSETKK